MFSRGRLSVRWTQLYILERNGSAKRTSDIKDVRDDDVFAFLRIEFPGRQGRTDASFGPRNRRLEIAIGKREAGFSALLRIFVICAAVRYPLARLIALTFLSLP